MEDRVFSVEEVAARAYRLAFGEELSRVVLGWDDAEHDTAETAWRSAVEALCRGTLLPRDVLAVAILALALLPEGGGVLGRWECQLKPAAFGCGVTSAVRPTKSRAWTHELAPGAYLDGTAQELLLLMCAADELLRREVQP